MHVSLIIGPQASGKGTQAEHMATILGVPHVSMGDVFRHEAATRSELGKQLKEYMDRGDLIPKELNNTLVKQTLEEHPDGIILDGYPRTMEQAQFLEEHATVDYVIVLRVPDNICVERISGRRVCDKGHDYHITYNPPKKEGVCDVDGLELHMRDDDKPDAIAHRLEIYHEETEPIIDFYKKKGVVLEIDGSPSIADVKRAVEEALR